MAQRRFPPPWSIDEYNDACFIVKDSNGQQLAYVYFENEPGRRAATKLLTNDEARRIAANLAKLPKATENHKWRTRKRQRSSVRRGRIGAPEND